MPSVLSGWQVLILPAYLCCDSQQGRDVRYTPSISCCQDSVMPICVNINFDTCKIRCGFMGASDTCEQLSYMLFENGALLIVESHVNILVLTDLFSAVSCYSPGPNSSLQATCPAAVWDSTPLRMFLSMYAILRQGP